jgi:hypothetical protein
MFECFRLSVSYEKPTNLAHVRVSISEDTVDQLLRDGTFLGGGGGKAPIVERYSVAPAGLPRKMQRRLLRNVTLWGLQNRPSEERCDRFMREVRLMNSLEIVSSFQRRRFGTSGSWGWASRWWRSSKTTSMAHVLRGVPGSLHPEWLGRSRKIQAGTSS